MINEFLDWAQEQQDVWIVSNEQLLAWVQNPVPLSQLDTIEALKCSTPDVDPSLQVCNGIPQNEVGLVQECAFSDFPFYTCVSTSTTIDIHYPSLFVYQYGCPQSEPSPSNPNPPQQITSGQRTRFRRKPSFATWFNLAKPILVKYQGIVQPRSGTPSRERVSALHQRVSSQITPVLLGSVLFSSFVFYRHWAHEQPNNANLTGGGTGGDSSASQPPSPTVFHFNGASGRFAAIYNGVTGLVGMLVMVIAGAATGYSLIDPWSQGYLYFMVIGCSIDLGHGPSSHFILHKVF